jgi:hypothetical protein
MRGMEIQATDALELGSQTETHIICPLWRRNNYFLVLCIVIFSLNLHRSTTDSQSSCYTFFSIFMSKTRRSEQNS